MQAIQQSDGSARVPGAVWWPMREMPASRFHGGTWIVAVGLYTEDLDRPHTQSFIANFGAVVDDFGNLTRVAS